jgi:H+/Cl- antiporter ClcA
VIDPQVQPKPYVRLTILALVMGLATAVITFAFVAVVQILTDALWVDAADAIRVPSGVFALVVCSLGGLLVGVLVRIFGDHSGIFADVMAEFGRTGRFDYRNAPGSSSPRSHRSWPAEPGPRLRSRMHRRSRHRHR